MSTVRLNPTDWQKEDLDFLSDLQASANWSQMGCFKTSTALWLTESKTKRVKNPAVLIVTTKSGKGSYFRDIPRCLTDDWKIFNIQADGVYLVMSGHEIKIGKYLAETIDFPHIVVTHYNTFSKSNLGKSSWCDLCKGKGKSEALDVCPKCLGKKRIAKPLLVCDYIMQREWDMAILDEAHRIKNSDTKWSRNLKKLKTKNKHIMTGSGFVNRPDEIWSLLNFLDKKTFSSYWRFRDEFCEEDYWSGYRQIVGLRKNRVEKFRSIRRDFGPRRTKPECFPHLTEPIIEDIEIELNPIQRKMYDQIKHELMLLDQKGEPLHSPNVLSQLQRMRQISVATPEVLADFYDHADQKRVVKVRLTEPSAKLDALMEIIEGLQWDDEDHQQIVVFSNFNDPLEMLQTRLNKSGINWLRLRQADSDQERYQKWAVEFPKKEHQVFMSTIKLGGESIDLTSAQYVAFLDMDWAPANNDQAIARVWRPGYTHGGAPVVIRIFAKNTVDKYILNMNETKAKWFKAIFHDDENLNLDELLKTS